jgi:hypothetical protein
MDSHDSRFVRISLSASDRHEYCRVAIFESRQDRAHEMSADRSGYEYTVYSISSKSR